MKSALYKGVFIISLISSALLNRLKPGYMTSMLFYILMLIIVLEVISVICTNLFIRFDSKIDKRTAIKGNMINYNFVVENSSFLMLCPIELFFFTEDMLNTHEESLNHEHIYLQPYQKKYISKEINCQYRGSYNIGVYKIKVTGFFKLVHFTINHIETHKILVYPNINEFINCKFKQTSLENTNSVVEVNQFDKNVFSDVRDYQQGDPVSKIHWKLSARRDSLISKDYEGNTTNATKIIINNQRTDLGTKENIVIEDYIIEGCVSLVKYFLHNFTELEMYWNDTKDTKLIKGNKKKEFHKVFKELALMKFNNYENGLFRSLQHGTRSQEHTLLIVATSVLDEKICKTIISKKKQGYEVVVVLYLENNHEKIKGKHLVASLISNGIEVEKFIFEEGYCRLDVIQ